MSNHTDADEWDSVDNERPEEAAVDGIARVESYEIENGVVFYDAKNPLAWLQASRTLLLSDQA
ncbi:MAG: DUF7331 family protein [Halobacteriota archaeon]